MHWTTYNYFGGNFSCGRPWHRYGIQYALPDCSAWRARRAPRRPSRTPSTTATPRSRTTRRGYPQLTSWGSTKNLTYEGMYWRWVQRAWASGMRLMVMA